MRADQETSLTTLLDKIQARSAETLVERTAVESHQSMNREVAGLLRTLKAALEAWIGGKVWLDHDLISWMIRHSAWLITRFRVRASGHTAYELIRQLKYGGAIVEFGEIVWARIPTTKKLGKLDRRWVEVVWAGRAESRDEHIGLDRRGGRRFRAVRREPESSRWRREVILEVVGCPWDMRPVGRTSPPDAFIRVAVFGDHAPAAQAAGTAAAEAELPAAEPPQPDDDWADIANTPITVSGRRLYITDAMVKRFGASMSCPRCQNGTGTHSNACRARMLGSMASQTSVAPPAFAVDMAVDRQGPEAGGEERGHEDRGRDAVMEAADDLQGQASSSSLQERSESSKVRRIMGLETCTAEQEPGADEEEQPGAEEVALERKKQFEAVCPLLLEVGEVRAAPTLEDLTPAKPVYATKSGAELDPQPVAAGRRKQLRALEEQKAIILVPHDFPLPGWGESHQEQVAR